MLHLVNQYKALIKPEIKALAMSDAYQEIIGPKVNNYQLTKVDTRILLTLENGRAETKSQLAERLVYEPACLTRSLERMLDQGLVAKFVDQTDKRYVRITLTEKGETLAHKIRDITDQVWEGICDKRFTAQEVTQLLKLLDDGKR